MPKIFKKCAISGCTYTEAREPKKLLFCAPRDHATRGLWIMATGKDYSHSSRFFVCEDHFDLSTDVEYIKLNGKPKLTKFTHPTRMLEGNNPLMQGISQQGSHSVEGGPVTDAAASDVGHETVECDVVIHSDSDPNELQYFRPLKRKRDDLAQTPETSGEKSDIAAKDSDFEPTQ